MARMFEQRDSLVLVRNAVKCLQCNKVIESKDRHDFRTCGCPNQTMVDGGLEYERRGAVDLSKVESLSEYSMPNCTCGHTWDDHHHGVVMNPKYQHHPLTYHGVMAQECEATQTNGQWHDDKIEGRCYCGHYEARDLNMLMAAKTFDNHLMQQEAFDNGYGEREESGKTDSGTEEDSGERTDVERAIKRDAGATPEDFKDLENW